jgi:hypothetical protein
MPMLREMSLGLIKPTTRAKMIFNAAAVASGRGVSKLRKVPTTPPRSSYTIDLTRILIAHLVFEYHCEAEATKLFKTYWRTIYEWNLKYKRELKHCPDVQLYLARIMEKLHEQVGAYYAS